MDGNGRWAKRRLMPRVAGHRKGVEALRGVIRACAERGIPHLTVFAFSSENWRRPQEEVTLLMELFMRALENEVAKLHENGIRLKIVGDLSPLDRGLVKLVEDAERLTDANDRLTLTIAVNYGGRWDILQAMNRLTQAAPERAGNYTEADITPLLAMNYAPEPDLFIRTGGEQRISNFLLWGAAYAELHFSAKLWPDFDEADLMLAIADFQSRERRFGGVLDAPGEPLTSEAP